MAALTVVGLTSYGRAEIACVSVTLLCFQSLLTIRAHMVYQLFAEIWTSLFLKAKSFMGLRARENNQSARTF